MGRAAPRARLSGAAFYTSNRPDQTRNVLADYFTLSAYVIFRREATRRTLTTPCAGVAGAPRTRAPALRSAAEGKSVSV